jgi:two-component system chemotaxis response regulator CheB
LTRRGNLPAVHPRNGEPIQNRRIYVAPPDHHLLVDPAIVRVTHGPRENGHRPAVDPLFRTAARAYGPQVIGVILSGSLDDGTAGLLAIKGRGGIAVVQDPAEALYAGMPQSAIEHTQVDHIVRLAELGPLLIRLAQEPANVSDVGPVSRDMEIESEMAELDEDAMNSQDRPGTPSAFACPDCGGVLWELRDGELIRFRCRVGHAFSAETLLATQFDQLEDALWVALRALEESAGLAERMEQHAQSHNHTLTAKRLHEQSEEARQRANVIRRVLLHGLPETTEPQEQPNNGRANNRRDAESKA